MKSIKETAVEYAKTKHTNQNLIEIVSWDFEAGANYVLEIIEDIVSNPRRYVSADTTVPEGMINDIVKRINELKKITRATIKSYTDVDQSKKLAGILPLESADMYYEPAVGFCTEPSEPRFGDIKYAHPRSIRCWSLTALLSVLPEGTRLLKSAINDTYHCDCPKGNIDKWFDNPVDACYEMIMRLNELNLL